MSLTIDQVLADVDSMVEVCVEVDSAKRSDGTLRTWYFTSSVRETGPTETPANTSFLPFIRPGGVLGPLAQSLSEDVLFSGLAENNPGTLTLIQPNVDTDQLSEMNDYVFAGYKCRVKIGRTIDVYASFAVYRTITISIDPVIQLTADGLKATFQLSSALKRMLEENLIVKRYLGIPHCLKLSTTAGKVTITKQSVHDVARFTIGIKFRIPSIPSQNRRLWSKSVSPAGADDHWFMNIQATTGLFRLTASSGGAANIVFLTSSSVCDGKWHSVIYGRDDATFAYVIFDNGDETTYTPTGVVNTSNANLIIGENLAGNFATDFCDARMMRYMTPDEARSYFAVRSNGDDLGVVGLWRFDDNSGATVNDYSANNADGAISGVLNTDYSWLASDLGEPELSGNPYPLVVGNVLNARAHLIDGVRERYRGNNDAIGWQSSGSNTTLTVKSQGTALTGGGVDYTTPSDGGDGVFSMTSQEAEPVTYDIVNNGTSEENTYPPSIAENILINRSRLIASDISNKDPLRILCPWPSGYHTDKEATAQQALKEILGESGLYYFEEPLGSLWLDMLLPPVAYGPYGEPCIDLRSGYVSWGDIADITGSCTIAAWFKSNVLDQTSYNWSGTEPNQGSSTIVTKGNSNYHLYFQSIGADAGKIKFRTATGLPTTTLSSPVGLIEPSVWYFVAGVFDDTANTQKIYIGKQGGTIVEVASQSNTNPQSTNSLGLLVGENGRYSFQGVQYAQVWSTAKTLAQLQSLMAVPPVGNEANLSAYFPLNEGVGSPLDLVSGTSGTINGTAQWAPKMVINLDNIPSIKLLDFHHIHPTSDIIVRYAKNRFPMSNSDIDTGVSQNNRLSLTRSGPDVRLENTKIKGRFKNAKKIVLDSSIIDQESAQRLLRVINARFGTDRYVGVLQFPAGLNESRVACGLTLGDEIGLVGSIPSQIQTPRSFRVVSVAPNPLKLETNVTIFG